MTEKRTDSLTRRQALAGAGIVAGLAAGVTVPRIVKAEATADMDWDHDADIVCVGSGGAAMMAAVSGVLNGAKVIVLESLPITGGTTRKSGGVAWVPNNFVMRANGVEDSKDDCMRYMVRFAYPQQYDAASPTLGVSQAEYDLLSAFYDNGSVALETLRDNGVVDFEAFEIDGVGPPPDYADHLPENKVPTGRPVLPKIGNGQKNWGYSTNGRYLIDPMEDWLTNKGVPILLEHRATRLVMADGRVVGIEAEADGKTVRIGARKGVIFGTGGYANSADKCHTHQKALYGSCCVPSAVGDFIDIGGAAGAAMGPLGTAWRSQVVLEEALKTRVVGGCLNVVPADAMFFVNKFGKRVVNEKRNYNDRTEAHLVYDPVAVDYPNQLLFMVFDQRVVNAFGGSFPIPADPANEPRTIIGADWDDLSTKISERLASLSDSIGAYALSPDFGANLKDTAARFNGFARSSQDLDFGRGAQNYDRIWQIRYTIMREDSTEPANDMPNSTMYPLRDEGPYYAVILAAGALDTSGGPQVNAHAQVLGTDGAPIPGLYAAGNCIACPTREAYYGAGGTIGVAMAFGHIAAVSAVKDSA